MNKFLILFLFLFGIISSNAQQKIHFQYDVSGNQIVREWCPTCDAKNLNETPKEIADLKEEDLVKFFPEDVISYYPNPVKEELFLKWQLINNNAVSSIDIYSLNGQLIKGYKSLEKTNSQTIPFQAYPAGVYNIILFYNNGEQKTIKIIKQ